MTPDFHKIDLLIKYVLAVAGQESGWDREIGAIHIVKYIYLADLAYARHHNGETYTGIPWQFHHYGPWSYDLYELIEPILDKVGARKKQIQSEYDKDFVRWSNTDDNLFDTIDDQIDIIVAGSIQKNHRKFTNSTYDLLHHVYRTKPMLYAAPDEYLNFALMVEKFPEEVNEKSA
ncbi:MAG: SocA family protein, partial [candidate division Zixibacteria bacterium]|nr:SocA family protein [candidate division Zixibacteria bacterium]